MNRQMRRRQQRQKIKTPQHVVSKQDIVKAEVVQVPAWDLPQFRQQVAEFHQKEKDWAIVTYGGIGDVLCAEPTVRYTVEILKPGMNLNSVTVVTRFPDLFKHLDVEILATDRDGFLEIPDGRSKYLWLYCGLPEGNLQHSFFTHNSMLPIDYPAVSALKSQLPLGYRFIQTPVEEPPKDHPKVFIHAGAHWESKRFPVEWWDEVLHHLADMGIPVALIGGPPTLDQANPGTVDINPSGCLDLRGKLKFSQTAGYLKHAHVLITNDSFPLHLATIGNAFIGFLATAKDPEWLLHYRMNLNHDIQFGWRMQNLALGGSYQRSFKPKAGGNHLSKATLDELKSWLPQPLDVAIWTKDKLKDYHGRD